MLDQGVGSKLGRDYMPSLDHSSTAGRPVGSLDRQDVARRSLSATGRSGMDGSRTGDPAAIALSSIQPDPAVDRAIGPAMTAEPAETGAAGRGRFLDLFRSRHHQARAGTDGPDKTPPVRRGSSAPALDAGGRPSDEANVPRPNGLPAQPDAVRPGPPPPVAAPAPEPMRPGPNPTPRPTRKRQADDPHRAYRQGLAEMRRAAVAAFGFSAILNLLLLTGSIYMLQVYDRVLTSGSVETLVALFGLVVVLYGFHAFFDVVRARILGRAAARVSQRVGQAAFGLGLERRGADATALRDLDALRATLGGPAMHAVFDAPWMPLFVAILFIVHPWLGWVTVGGALLSIVLAIANHLVTRRTAQQVVDREGVEREFAERVRRSSESVVGMGMQDVVTSRWQGLRDATLSAQIDTGARSDLLAGLSRAVRMLLQSAVLTVGAYLVLQGQMSGGMIVAASILSGRALAPVDQLTAHWRTLQRGLLARKSLDRTFRAAALREPSGFELPDPVGRMDLTDVSVLAPPVAGVGGAVERRALLSAVTLSIGPGQGVGIVGASGSGKSTLARILLGIQEPDSGEVRLDGATYNQWDRARIGRHLGYLPQSPEPLSGTVRDLIARFDDAVSDAVVIDAAKLVGLHDFILTLPRGYATRIGGEGGMTLSGGQAQRLSLARAMCGRPQLVVLDEPNAHLDTAGEAALSVAIRDLIEGGSTVVVVTHRSQVLGSLDRIVVLDAGRIVRDGGRDEMMAAARPAPAFVPVRAEDATPSEADHAAASLARGPTSPVVVLPTATAPHHPAADPVAMPLSADDAAPRPDSPRTSGVIVRSPVLLSRRSSVRGDGSRAHSEAHAPAARPAASAAAILSEGLVDAASTVRTATGLPAASDRRRGA